VKNLERSAQSVASSSRRFTSSSVVLSSLFSFIVGALLMYSLFAGLTAKNSSSPAMSAASSQSYKAIANDISIETPHEEQAVNNRTYVYDRTSTQTALDNTAITDNAFALSSLTLDESSLSFASRQTDVPFSNATSIQNGAIGNVAHTPEMSLTDPLGTAYLRKWYDESGILSSDITTEHSPKGYFGFVADADEPSSIIEHTTASLRSGGGQAPGSSQKISASLIEMKFSADLTDWLVAKVSFGQFMPHETEAINKGLNADGVRSLKLESILQYKSVVGAELGVRFNVLHAPVELMVGVLSDMTDGIIPRASVFTNVMLQDNLSLHIGAEVILYQHDIRPSLRDKQNLFATDHPVLVSAMKEKELDGFIGPAIELAWHF
jgi:hypothetical protein